MIILIGLSLALLAYTSLYAPDQTVHAMLNLILITGVHGFLKVRSILTRIEKRLSVLRENEFQRANTARMHLNNKLNGVVKELSRVISKNSVINFIDHGEGDARSKK